MGDITALQAAVAANTQAVSDVAAKVVALEATISSTSDQTGIDAAAAQIVANNAALDAIVNPPAPVTPPSS